MTASGAKRAYDVAARFFESAADQYTELASEVRTKQATAVIGSALLTAASVALASASAYQQAHQQAHQMAEISALRSAARGGSGHGRGVGYGSAPFQVFTPDSPVVSAKEYEAKAAEVRQLAQVCKQKAECYNKVGAGQEKTCIQK